MLLFSQVGWSRDSWWLLIIHSACSHCITDYLASIVCERGLTPPPQTQTSYIRELAGGKKSSGYTEGGKIQAHHSIPSNLVWGMLQSISERPREELPRFPGRRGEREVGAFWHTAAFCSITLPSVFRLSLASEQNTCSSGQELCLVHHSPLKPRHKCHVLSALQMCVVNCYLQFLISRCDGIAYPNC